MARDIPINETLLSNATPEDVEAVTALFVQHGFMVGGDKFISSKDVGNASVLDFPGDILGDLNPAKAFCEIAVNVGAAALAAASCTVAVLGTPAAVALCLAGVEAGRQEAIKRC